MPREREREREIPRDTERESERGSEREREIERREERSARKETERGEVVCVVNKYRLARAQKRVLRNNLSLLKHRGRPGQKISKRERETE